MRRRLMLAAGAVLVFAGMARSATQPSNRKADLGAFLVLHEGQTHLEAFGMVMECPSHAHGTQEEAYRKLKDILAARDPELVCSIQVCRHNQLETLEKFAPLADQMTVHPFIAAAERPQTDLPLWKDADHPLLNHLVRVRMAAGRTRLLAKTSTDGPEMFFRHRPASWEEVEWTIFAAIGGHYQGIAWRGKLLSNRSIRRFRTLVQALEAYDHDLGTAVPVDWAKIDQPRLAVSALRSPNRLFVVFLDLRWMQLTSDQKDVAFPLELEPCAATCAIRLPPGMRITAARTLYGEPVAYDQQGRACTIRWEPQESCQLVVMELAEPDALAAGPASDSRTAAGRALRSEGSAGRRQAIQGLYEIIQQRFASLEGLEWQAQGPPSEDLLQMFAWRSIVTPPGRGLVGRYARALAEGADGWGQRAWRRLLWRLEAAVLERAKQLWPRLPSCQAELAEAVLLMPLTLSDRQWDRRHAAELVRWCPDPWAIAEMEQAAVSLGRPVAAWRIRSAALERARQENSDSFAGYVINAADFMNQRREYRAALECLRAGLSWPQVPLADMRYAILLRLAQMYQRLGHVDLALQQTAEAMNLAATPRQRGLAVLHRLRFMHDAGACRQILSEHSDEEFAPDGPYAAQCLYLLWLAARRCGDARAALLREAFLRDYPGHSLAAEVFFADAIDALHAGQHSRLLETLGKLIEQHPKTAAADQARQMQVRLQQAMDLRPVN